MTKDDYKEKMKPKLTARLYTPVKAGSYGTVIIDGVIGQFTNKGFRKLGFIVSGQEYAIPPQPLNKKEKRKMRDGKPFLDKKRNLVTLPEVPDESK